MAPVLAFRGGARLPVNPRARRRALRDEVTSTSPPVTPDVSLALIQRKLAFLYAEDRGAYGMIVEFLDVLSERRPGLAAFDDEGA